MDWPSGTTEKPAETCLFPAEVRIFAVQINEMVTTVIFDLDGTLLDTIGDLAISCNHLLKKYGFPEHEVEAYKYFVGNGMAKLVHRALPESAATPDFEAVFLREFIAYYQQHQEDCTQPYDGIPEMLAALQTRELELAVASNKIDASTKALTQKYFPEISFSAVYGQRETISPKPDPTIIHDILNDLHKKPENTVMIGDSAVDMQTAKNAQLTAIGVLWGFRTEKELLENGADYIVAHPKEIPEFLEKL